jgi:endonuclease YncB( thermonuclease family)
MVGRTMTRMRSRWLIWGVALLAIGSAATCTPQERVSGRARVTDGDSLEIGSVSIRLWGVDAPEGRQSCTRGGRDWDCGNEAARQLRSLIGGRAVVCEQRDVDDYGRVVAVCRSGATDLAAEMARSGLAVAYRRYSGDYVDEENEARRAERGLWAGEFARPEDYRREERAATRARRDERALPARRAACRIKGNINGDGERIYHVPGSRTYDDTVIETSSGERWFCTEAEARSQGWRAPRG